MGATFHGRLAILVDTEETLHVVDQWIKLKEQSRVYSQLAPAAAAQLINVIVYAAARREENGRREGREVEEERMERIKTLSSFQFSTPIRAE